VQGIPPRDLPDGDTLTAVDGRLVPASTIAGAVSGSIAVNTLASATGVGKNIKGSQIADGVTGGVLTIAGTLTTGKTKFIQNSTGTLAELETGQTFTGIQVFQSGVPITARQGTTQDAIIIAPPFAGSSSNSITDTTPATGLGGNFIQTRQAATGTPSLIEVQPCASFQNKLINPRFEIAQRGTTFTPTLNTETYDLDRFFTKIDGTSLVFTVSQQAHTLGTLINEPAFFRRCAITTAGTASTVTKILAQRIESVRPYSNKSLIVTFKAKADAARTVTPNYVQCFGTGGAPSANVTGAGSGIALTTSWVTYTQVIALPSISGKTMGTTVGTDYLELWFSAAANTVQTIDISDIEFKEVATSGQVNSPFEIRPLQVEWALCQRYYQAFISQALLVGEVSFYASSTTILLGTFSLKVTMRATPSMAFQSQGTGGGGNTVRNSGTNVAVTITSPTTFLTANAVMGIISSTAVLIAATIYDFGVTLNAEL